MILKIKQFVFILLLLIFKGVNAQELSWVINDVQDTTSTASAANYAVTYETIWDNDSNIISVGYYRGEVDFDPSDGIDIHESDHYLAPGVYQSVGFIKKLDQDGNFLWATTLNTSGSSSIKDVAVDNIGNCYIVGSFSSQFNSPLGIMEAGAALDVFVVKLNSSGDFVWQKSFGGDETSETGMGIAVDAFNTVIFTGKYNYRYNFTTGQELALGGKERAYVCFLNQINSNYVGWIGIGEYILENPGSAEGLDVSFTQSNEEFITSFILTGTFSGTANLTPFDDPDIRTATGTDVFIVKYSSFTDSPLIWAETFDPPVFSSNEPHKMLLDDQDNVYYNIKGELRKYSSQGSLLWTNNIVLASTVDFGISNNGMIYEVGKISSSFNNFNGNPGAPLYTIPTVGGMDIFIRKIDTDGIFHWARTIGTTATDEVSNVLVGNDGFYIGGRIPHDLNLDFDLSSNTVNLVKPNNLSFGSYLAKYDNCFNTLDTLNMSACSPTTYEGVNLNSTGQYYIVKNEFGACDSIEIVNFTLGVNTTSTQTISSCGPFDFNGQVYSDSGTFTQVLTNNSGCDSTVTLNLTINSIPTTTLSLSNDTICGNETITGIASGASGYTWNVNGSTSSTNNFDFPPQITAYNTTIIVIGTNTNGGISCSVSDTVSITVLPLPTTSVSGNTAICNGDSTTLTGSGASTYEWNTGSLTSTENFSPTATTNYSLIGWVNGCSVTETFQINVTNYPILSISSVDTFVCQGQSTSLQISGADNYIWSDGLGTNSMVTVSPMETNIYSVIGTINGCSDTAYTTITFIDELPPTLVITPDITICQYADIDLTVSGAQEYMWDQGLGSGSSHNVTPTSSILYTVIGENNGCFNEASVFVTLIDNPYPIINLQFDQLSTGEFASYQWYIDGLPIEGAIDQTITLTQNGTYYVEIENSNGCMNISDNYIYNSVSVVSLKDEFNVFPNPSNGEFRIKTSQNIELIQVVDLLGKLVDFDYNANNGILLLKNVSKGNYMLSFTMNGLNSNLKLIVE